MKDLKTVSLCKKVCYTTKEFAELDIKRFKFKDDGRVKPIRSYKCDRCNTYHITKNIDYEATNLFLVSENLNLRSKIIDLESKISELSWFGKYQKMQKRYDELSYQLKSNTLYQNQETKLIELHKIIKNLRILIKKQK